MKKVLTLCALAISAIFSNAQVVLNEVYTDPGAGKHEFFELYNTSTNATPENLNNFTIISYYEETGGKSGFYIMDLPNQTVSSKGFYVGAASSPLNVQAQTNVSADFSWQSMPAGGALSKWEKSGSGYIQAVVPSNLNDLFVKISGNGASYHIFVYKNGILVNGLLGGTNSNTIPSYITSMPDLAVDMSGASPDFTIKFSSINNNQVEYVTAVPGSDNGYIREKDGKCRVWVKGSSQVNHNPGKTNGSASDVIGELTIASFITELTGDATKALLVYNITDGPVDAFAVVVEVYRDLGIIGELDAADILADTRTINDKLAGEQNIELPNRNEPVIIVAKSPAGCYDLVRAIANNNSILPVHLIRFQGNLNKNNKVTLTWTAADNETVDHFEVERSVNGKDFTTVAMVFATEKYGTEDYQYTETINSNDKVMFRLKMFDKGQDIDYSKILVFQPKSSNTNEIKIYGNPVNDKLTFSYTSNETQTVNVKVYDLTGKVIMSQKVNSLEGSNMMSLPLASTFKTGMYVVEVSNGTDRQTAKFVKQ